MTYATKCANIRVGETMIDLHQHSTFSDGTDDIVTLVKKNKAMGIEYMSVTDHDNIQSAKALLGGETSFGIKFVTGIEFSTEFEGESIHLLAYGYRKNGKVINSLVKKSKELRLKRIKDRIDILKKEFGIVLSKEELEIVEQSDNPNKPLLANILISRGLGENITEVIKKYLYHKMPENKLNTQYVIKELAKANIISVYAHPLGGVGEKRVERSTFEKRAKAFSECGLNGIECYYSLYNKEEQNYLTNYATTHNLLISGGSDYHGKNKTVQIGELSNYNFSPIKENLTIAKRLKFKSI